VSAAGLSVPVYYRRHAPTPVLSPSKNRPRRICGMYSKIVSKLCLASGPSSRYDSASAKISCTLWTEPACSASPLPAVTLRASSPVSATFGRFSRVAGSLRLEEGFRRGTSSTPGLRPKPLSVVKMSSGIQISSLRSGSADVPWRCHEMLQRLIRAPFDHRIPGCHPRLLP